MAENSKDICYVDHCESTTGQRREKVVVIMNLDSVAVGHGTLKLECNSIEPFPHVNTIEEWPSFLPWKGGERQQLGPKKILLTNCFDLDAFT